MRVKDDSALADARLKRKSRKCVERESRKCVERVFPYYGLYRQLSLELHKRRQKRRAAIHMFAFCVGQTIPSLFLLERLPGHVAAGVTDNDAIFPWCRGGLLEQYEAFVHKETKEISFWRASPDPSDCGMVDERPSKCILCL
jgi:hypothetical protein